MLCFSFKEVLNITANKLEEIIKPLNDYEETLKHKYAEMGSPDSTEEMKNLESRQAAVTLLQIKNYDPSKYIHKQEEDTHSNIVFNSGPSLPPAERAREVMHCNAVIDIISKAVAVAQRENEESQKFPQNYSSVIDRTHAKNPSEVSYQHDYPEEKYNAYNASHNPTSPGAGSNDDHDKEIDLSLYTSCKTEPTEPSEHTDREIGFFDRTLTHKKTLNFADEYKQHVFGQSVSKTKMSKENSSVYEDCSQSSSGSDPDRLQMDISQMSQVGIMTIKIFWNCVT